MPRNYERLKDAGLILDECPEPHRAVLDALSEEEMTVIMKVKERLDEADASMGAKARPPFTNCIAF